MSTPFQTHSLLLPRVAKGAAVVNANRYAVLTNPVTRCDSEDPPLTRTAATTTTTSTGITFVNHNAPIPAAQPHPHTRKRTSAGSGENDASKQTSSAGAVPAATAAPAPAALQDTAAASARNPHRGSGTQQRPPHGQRGSVTTYGATAHRRSDGNGASFSVAGVRTGEEVVVGDVDKRQPRKGDPIDPARESRVKTLQAEVKALSEKLKKNQAARQRQKELTSVQLAEMEARRALELAFLVEHRGAASWRLANSLARAAHAALIAGRSAFDKEVGALQGRIAEYRTAMDAEQHKQLAAVKAEQEAAAAAEHARAQQNKDEVARLRAELEEQTTRFAREKQQMEAALADTQNRLRESDEAKRKLAGKMAEDMFLLAQCRLFVKNVCQPGFNVVKGTGLEPVDKERTEPTGFVLVPLVVLLHGYTLLPAEDRKEVIDHYESQAAALQT